MQEFVDIHCHLLPGVDDGPETLEASLELAEELCRVGFTTVIATPHFIEDYSQSYRTHILEQYKLLTETLSKEDIPLKVLLGGEILMTPQIIEQAKQKTLPTLHNTNYVLIEFPFFQPIPSYAKRIFFTLKVNGYQPILAHPERTRVFQEDLSQLADNIKEDVLLQINIGSLLGKYGSEVKRTAEHIIDLQLAHFLASDSHSHRSNPQLSIFLSHQKHLLPLLLHENPHKMLSNGRDIKLPNKIATSYILDSQKF